MNLISIKNLNKKNHIKIIKFFSFFNKTFTDWDVMDEHADAMNDFALIVCKVNDLVLMKVIENMIK